MVVATLRSDYLSAFQEFASKLDIIYEAFHVEPMSRTNLREVIEKPASLAALELESGFVEAALENINNPDALPLLANALHRVWNIDALSGCMTCATLRGLGGALGSLEGDAGSLIKQLDADDLEAVRIAFLMLTEIGSEGTFVRRAATWNEMPPRACSVLKKFINARLIVADQ
jgi:hypothetical protein